MLGYAALGSTALSALDGAPNILAGSVTASATTSATLNLVKNLSANVLATNITATVINVDKRLSQNLSVTANTQGTLSLNKQLSQNISSTATVTSNLQQVIALTSNINATAAVTATIAIHKQLSQSITATASTTGLLALTKNLSQNLSVSASASAEMSPPLDADVNVTTSGSGTLSLTKDLQTYLFTRGTIGEITATTAVGVDIDFVMSGAYIPPDPLNVDFTTYYLEGTAYLTLGNALSANISASASAQGEIRTNLVVSANVVVSSNATIDVFNALSSPVTVSATASGSILLNHAMSSNATASATLSGSPTVKKDLSGSISVEARSDYAFVEAFVGLETDSVVTVSTTADLTNQVALATSATATATTTAPLSLTKNLSANVSAEVTIFLGFPIYGNIVVNSGVYGLLDVDGNTEGSPGGVPVEGFYPPTSVILANHNESDEAETYTITADIEPGYTTEIIDLYADLNPNNVIQLSYENNIASIYLNTPMEVYGMSTTFTVSRDVVPQYNSSFNYNLQFNATLTNNSRGNNFRSTKFYIYGNELPCFLRDDGAGFVTLFEEQEPGLIRKLKDVGKIDYSTGELSVEGLKIVALVDAFLRFSATSLNSAVPTTDYFDAKNSLLVQAKTVAFPTGENVEIYQYSKAEELIDVYITVVARAFNPATPEITVDQREAVYKLTILPDYNLGKTQLQQLLQAA